MPHHARIIWYDRLDSTNDEALRQIREIDNLSVIAAREQTAGRGQRGNTWTAAPGENLTFSLVLRFGPGGLPAFPAAGQFRLTAMMTLAVRQYLAGRGIDARIKWPNDLYVGDRKICGMLIENGLHGSEMAYSVLGVGLNVNQAVFPETLPNPTSMTRVTGERYDAHRELEALIAATLPLTDRLQDAEGLHAEYLRHLYRRDAWRDYVDCASGTVFRAAIRSVTPEGLLLLAPADGGPLRPYRFKEVNYIL